MSTPAEAGTAHDEANDVVRAATWRGGPAAVGRRRRLLRLANPLGIVIGLALDHRDSFRAALVRAGFTDVDAADIRKVKRVLIQALADDASVLMLDEEFGRDALLAGDVPPHVALVMPLEAQGYEEVGDGRETRLLADFSPGRAAAYGADACKLLLPFRSDLQSSAERQERLVQRMAETCHQAGLPLIVEPTPFQLAGESADRYASVFSELVVNSANRLTQLDVEMLKLPFPALDDAADAAAEAACSRLNDACAGRPWVLLGGQSSPASVQRQLQFACAAGASGFLAGRSIWGAALLHGLPMSLTLARQAARPLFLACRDIAVATASPLAAARTWS